MINAQRKELHAFDSITAKVIFILINQERGDPNAVPEEK